MAIKVFIADDHSMIREGLIQLLELEDNIVVIGQAANGEDALKQLKVLKPDVVLMDLNMPLLTGLEVINNLQKHNIYHKIIVLTIHNEIDYLIKAVEMGCNGYVLKDSDSNLLKKAIYTVYTGDTFIQPTLVPVLNSGLANRTELNNMLDDLTKREIEVLKLLARGLFNKEIAYELQISERTVKNHVSNIFKKIQVSDRTQAAVFAIKANLIDLS